MNFELLFGDFLELASGIPDESIDMVMCDPPYGMTKNEWDIIIPFEPMWEQLIRITKPNSAIVLNCVQPFTTALIHSNMKMFKYCWAFDKKSPSGFLNAKKRPLRRIEDIAVFYERLGTYNPQGLVWGPRNPLRDGKSLNSSNYSPIGKTKISNWINYPTNLLIFKSERGLHPTQRPVALMEYLIKTYTHEGEHVLDFTMGSGTTGVACVNTKRNFTGIELNKTFFDTAKSRIMEAQ